MRKKLLWVLVVLICGLATAILTGCSSDDDKAEAKTEVTMMYYVKVTDDVLKVADVEVNYVDQTGAKKKEALTSAEWKKTFNTNSLPLTEGIWAKITPKASIADGNYQLKVTTAAGYQAQLSTGKTVADGYGNNPDAAPVAAQTADEVAAWCAQSGTVAFTVSETGYAKATKVDFGGNDRGDNYDDEYFTDICKWFMWLFGADESDCD
jgi:hypothetical protein